MRLFDSYLFSLKKFRRSQFTLKIRSSYGPASNIKFNSKFLIIPYNNDEKAYTGVVRGHFDFNKHFTTTGRRQTVHSPHNDSVKYIFTVSFLAFISSRHKYLRNYILSYTAQSIRCTQRPFLTQKDSDLVSDSPTMCSISWHQGLFLRNIFS